jgi:hypothetical protein
MPALHLQALLCQLSTPLRVGTALLYLLHFLSVLFLLARLILFLLLGLFLSMVGEHLQPCASHGSSNEYHNAQDDDHEREHEPAAQSLDHEHWFQLCQ